MRSDPRRGYEQARRSTVTDESSGPRSIPGPRSRSSPRVTKRAISKHRAKGTIDRTNHPTHITTRLLEIVDTSHDDQLRGIAPDAACGGKPEWAGLACRAYPAAQPTGQTIPDSATTGYSMWLRPTTQVETSGTATRTTTTTYDGAERPLTSKVTATGIRLHRPPRHVHQVQPHHRSGRLHRVAHHRRRRRRHRRPHHHQQRPVGPHHYCHRRRRNHHHQLRHRPRRLHPGRQVGCLLGPELEGTDFIRNGKRVFGIHSHGVRLGGRRWPVVPHYHRRAGSVITGLGKRGGDVARPSR